MGLTKSSQRIKMSRSNIATKLLFLALFILCFKKLNALVLSYIRVFIIMYHVPLQIVIENIPVCNMR